MNREPVPANDALKAQPFSGPSDRAAETTSAPEVVGRVLEDDGQAARFELRWTPA